jgi:hypothetical protein
MPQLIAFREVSEDGFVEEAVGVGEQADSQVLLQHVPHLPNERR